MKNPVLSAFDKQWAQLRKYMSQQETTAALICQIPAKREVRKCLANQAYALVEYGELERMGAFEFILNLLVAEKDAIDYLIAHRKTKAVDMTPEDHKRFLDQISF